MQAAHDLLAEGNSYTELSIEQIAARAGISRSAFYFYFRDKRELLIRMVERVSELFYQEADVWWEQQGEQAALPDLKVTLTTVLGIWRKNAPLLAAIVETSGYDPEVAAVWGGIMGQFVDATRAHIEQEQKDGRALDVPAEATAYVLVWMTERIWYQHVMKPTSISDDDLVEALTNVMLNAVYGKVEAPEPS
jgi:AcrR family transcriptional regulator